MMLKINKNVIENLFISQFFSQKLFITHFIDLKAFENILENTIT
jgi:hypothetical protein